ncbi:hypothetical protein Q5691_24005 [Microcoleus sp. w1-18aA5]|uniref:hypothetical protein n=1 Tax=Microcoleus sp. w1-18aA5 TaxID=2818982 RepID=UPI002FD1B290
MSNSNENTDESLKFYSVVLSCDVQNCYNNKNREWLILAMQRIFEAILKGNLLEWANEVPRQGDVPIKVYVTLQEERSTLSAELRRQRIVEILEKIAANNVFADISDPVEWQQDLRQDRPLPGRDE